MARYTQLTVDDAVLANGFAATNASPGAKSFTIGANWYPTAFVKYYVTFERTGFAAGTALTRPAEHLILFRTQLAF